MRSLFIAVISLLAFLEPHVPFAAELRQRSILIIDQGESRGPFYNSVYSAFRSTVDEQPSPLSIYVEALDLNRFDGPDYAESTRAHLAVKYRGRPIGVIVAIGSATLRYVLRFRAELWPDVPVVFAFVDEQTLARLKLPRDVTGIVMQLRFADMLTAARALVPNLKRVAIVGDLLSSQTAFSHFVEEIPRAAADLEVIDLTGIPMRELRKKVSALPESTVILYTAIYGNGEGTFYSPGDALSLIAEVANRPIVGTADTYIGHGAVGGYMLIPGTIGTEAADLALRILNGEPATSIKVSTLNPVRPVFDWRELQHWKIAESRLPPASEVRFREITVWERYRWQITAVTTALMVQSILIISLLSAHRRRRAAEFDARGRLSEVAHLNRHAVTGQMSASLAHELNQPLGSILTNAQTAEFLLTSDHPDVEEIRTIVADIKRDDQRASEVIKRLRSYLTKTSLGTQDVDLNETVREVLGFLRDQAVAGKISLNSELASGNLMVRGDRIQLQQVVLNLILNGMDAITGTSGGPRQVSVSTAVRDSRVAIVSVKDSGHGIPEETLARIFEPFFTTKKSGMGMGLSIAGNIAHAHGGRIWAETPIEGGAIFRFELPLKRG